MAACLGVSMRRAIRDIAGEIRESWSNPYFGAIPYIDAMDSLVNIGDMYGCDSARSIVLYFLSNARGWRGETAKRIKAELKELLA